MKLNSILQSYLDKTLVTTTIKGGNADESNSKILENEILTSRLQNNSQFNNRIIITLITVLLFSFLMIGFLIWHFSDSNVVVLSLLGGEGLSILFIIRTLHRVYKDKVFTDQLLYLIPKLNTEAEKIKFIETLSDYLK